MAGNTTNKKRYTNDELNNLIEKYKNQTEKHFNPINNRILPTWGGFCRSVSYRMFQDQVNQFFFAITPSANSSASGELLTIDDFSHRRGYKKYTKDETKNHIWSKIYAKPVSESMKKRISEKLKTLHQSEQGVELKRKLSESRKAYATSEEGRITAKNSAIKQSITMKRLILEGVFTPCITNTWTHWDAVILENNIERKFRSSWEACFWFCNQHLEYETIRIKLIDRVIVNDFYDIDNRIMYEIKPISRYNTEIEKMTAFQEYCNQNNMKFIWINENNILDYLSEEKIVTNESAMKQYTILTKYNKNAKSSQ